MAENLLPISKTNVVLLVNRETTYATAPASNNTYKRLAFNAASLSRQQTLTPNPELRGTRMQGALVVGPKNPGGPIQNYQTSQTLPLFYEALFGARTTTEVGACGVTVSGAAGTASSNLTSGNYHYKVVVQKGANNTFETAPSAPYTYVSAGNNKCIVTRTGGALPTGWTWALYRTAVGGNSANNTAFHVVTGAESLAASVTSFTDDISDASIAAADTPPTTAAAGYGDYQHVITIAETLPSYTFERSLPYVLDTDAYLLATGSVCDTGRVQMRSTGYFDFQSNWLCQSVTTQAASAEDGTADDWRFGEKIHNAMIGTGKVYVDAAANGTPGTTAFGKFLDLTLDHNNNLDKTDYPLSLSGDRGSATPLQAITTVSGTVKVTEPSVLTLIQSAPELQTIHIVHDLATFGHSITHTIYGCQFDPMDPPVAGQGILTIGFTAHAVQDGVSGYQVKVTIINSEPTASYDANS